jgi:hypothetical protein
MTVSKRLRFEVFRRDGYACRYCGRKAPHVELTVDHVVPEALGGTDDPTNLVTACADCNSGKTSTPPDAALVADVSHDAHRWAAAMQQAADELRLTTDSRSEIYEAVWNAWTSYRRRGIPQGFERKLDRFLDAGLTPQLLVELAEVAATTPDIWDRWAYFCGCCWTRIRQLQDRAAEIVTQEENLDGT